MTQIDEIILKYNINKYHADFVKKFSVKIYNFLVTNKFLKKDKDLILLKYASMLHDIGRFVQEKSHHKISFELIMKENFSDLTQVQKLMLANIARYHRASIPNLTKHEHFLKLNEKNRKTVEQMAGILRISDALCDKTQRLIENFELEFDKNKNQIIFYLQSNLLLTKKTLHSAIKKKNLFEKIFGVNIIYKLREK